MSSADNNATQWNWPVVDLDIRHGQRRSIPIPSALENVEYALKQLGIKVQYNKMTKEIELTGGNLLANAPLDVGITQLRSQLTAHHLRISKTETWDAVSAIAAKHPYSPVCEYLRGCRKRWDGKAHIDDLFSLLKLDPKVQQDVDFCKTLLEKWLISAVKLAFNTGDTAAQGVLILVGPQGIGKTRFLYRLLPHSTWGADGITLDPGSRDDTMRIMRFWIVELGEVGNTLRKERMDALKQYITQKQDVFRRPYARSAEMIPRRTVFIGTVNELPGEGFLRDLTGNRRYWPIAITQVLNLPLDRDQLWGYIMNRAFDCQVPHYLSTAELAQLESLNAQHLLLTTEERLLLDSLNWNAPLDQWHRMTATDVCGDLCISPQNNRKVGRALQNIARRDPRLKTPSNHHQREYLVPPMKAPAWASPDRTEESGTAP